MVPAEHFALRRDVALRRSAHHEMPGTAQE
jgi:hypothetical protein